MESLGKPTVEWREFQRELYRLTNLEMFIGKNLVGEYFNSVNIQEELPYPDKYDGIAEHYERVPRTNIRHQ